jgi:hypothetical protein
VKPQAENDRRWRPRRSGQRILSAAEGVLVALRQCSLDAAFTEIVRTAKQYGVAPLELAGALVAIAENELTRDFDDAVIATVNGAWGALLNSRPSYAGDSGHAQQPPMTLCT